MFNAVNRLNQQTRIKGFELISQLRCERIKVGTLDVDVDWTNGVIAFLYVVKVIQ